MDWDVEAVAEGRLEGAEELIGGEELIGREAAVVLRRGRSLSHGAMDGIGARWCAGLGSNLAVPGWRMDGDSEKSKGGAPRKCGGMGGKKDRPTALLVLSMVHAGPQGRVWPLVFLPHLEHTRGRATLSGSSSELILR